MDTPFLLCHHKKIDALQFQIKNLDSKKNHVKFRRLVDMLGRASSPPKQQNPTYVKLAGSGGGDAIFGRQKAGPHTFWKNFIQQWFILDWQW